MGFGDNFSSAYEKSSASAGAGALELMKEKTNKDLAKAEAQLQATTINKAILELAAQSGDEQELVNTQKVLEAVGNNQPEASKLIYSSIQSRIKDKQDFGQTLQMERYKAATTAVSESIKALTEKGGYTPEELISYQEQVSNRAMKAAGLEDIASRIKQSSMAQEKQPTQAEPKTSFLQTPISAKKSEKQIDLDDSIQLGLKILNDTESQYEEIAKKYGTGRVKGLMTEFRGKMGDLLPKGEQAPEVIPYMNNLEGLANFIGKTVYKDERVSDTNIKGYKKALAELTNTPEEARIMFSTLRRYGESNSESDRRALRLMIPFDGKSKGMLPSEAIKKTESKKVDLKELFS